MKRNKKKPKIEGEDKNEQKQKEKGETHEKKTKRNVRLSSLKQMIRMSKNRKKKVKLDERKPETVLAEGEG